MAGFSVIVAFVVVGFWLWQLPSASTGNPACLPVAKPGADERWSRYNVPNEPLGEELPALNEFALLPDQRTSLQFGRAAKVRALDVDYAVSPAVDAKGRVTPLRVDITQFLRDDGEALAERKVYASARLISDDRVRVSLCVDRRDPGTLGDPGTYGGVVSVMDSSVGRVDLPLTVTMAWPEWSRVAILALVACLAGLWMAWLIHDKVGDSDPISLARFARWVVSALGLLSLGAGSFAAVQAYRLTYLDSGVWGASVGDPLTLLLACFTAFTGATVGLRIAGLAALHSKDSKAEQRASGTH